MLIREQPRDSSRPNSFRLIRELCHGVSPQPKPSSVRKSVRAPPGERSEDMELEGRGVEHLGTDQADALFKNACDEADSAGRAVETSNDDLRILALGRLNWLLQIHA